MAGKTASSIALASLCSLANCQWQLTENRRQGIPESVQSGCWNRSRDRSSISDLFVESPLDFSQSAGPKPADTKPTSQQPSAAIQIPPLTPDAIKTLTARVAEADPLPLNQQVKIHLNVEMLGKQLTSLNSFDLALIFDEKDLDVRTDPSDKSGLTLIVRALTSGPHPIIAKLTDKTDKSLTTTVALAISGGVVAGFTQLSVQLNLMDDATVTQLFGHVSASQFYVLRVRFFNNLNEDGKSPELQGKSIIVFSESIETRVGLEKKVDTRAKSEGRSDPKPFWSAVKKSDLNPLFGSAQRTDIPAVTQPSDEPQTTFVYRPFLSDIMESTVDARNALEFRERSFRGAHLAGLLLTFGESVVKLRGRWKDSLDFAGKASTILIPGLEALWPSLKEVERQNLRNLTMKQYEVVPFGQDLARIVFIPKGQFRGISRGYLFRVSDIDTSYFRVKAVVIGDAPVTTKAVVSPAVGPASAVGG